MEKDNCQKVKLLQRIEILKQDTDPLHPLETAQIQESPTFLGWLFQFGKQMRILSQAAMARQHEKKVKELAED